MFPSRDRLSDRFLLELTESISSCQDILVNTDKVFHVQFIVPNEYQFIYNI